MAMATEYVYLGRDNTIEFALSINGTVIDHTTITQVIVKGLNYDLDSDVVPSAFDFTDPDKLVLSFGAQPIKAGNYSMKLVVKRTGDTNGVVWYDDIPVKVRHG